MNVYEFFTFLKFSILGSISSMVIRHVQCTFITYDSAGTERNNFQQISKLIELKFISATWPH